MESLCDIIAALSKTLEINHRTVLNSITSKLPFGTETPQIEVMDEETNEESEVETKQQSLVKGMSI
jgi:hypothetical protein